MNISSCNALSEKASTLFSHFLNDFPADNNRTALSEKKKDSLFSALPAELRELYSYALLEKGCLSDNEIFCFSPALVLGSKAELSAVTKAKAREHPELLFSAWPLKGEHI